MERVCDYNICSGCGVCTSVCPRSCISMEEGEKGHLYPVIDTSLCIDCKKCERTCPALKEHTGEEPTVAYAAFARSEHEYMTTTSGGAAQILSLQTIKDGGIVYGCASLPGAVIRHIRIDNIADLELLKGSKYVQSDVTEVYKEIRSDIKSGRQVLFIGTPCQTAAVAALFPKRPENLLLVELICHGVPSQKSLQSYLRRYITDLKSVSRIRFRTEEGFQCEVTGSNGERLYQSVPLSKSQYGDRYYSPFFFGFSYRASCYTCPYAKPQRCSDITIGDFWGLGAEGNPPQFPEHSKGISLILPVTAKGKEMFGKVKDAFYYAERTVEEAIKGNKQLQQPTRHTLRIKSYEKLSHITGENMAFHLTNIDWHVRLFLRPYIHKIKKKR